MDQTTPSGQFKALNHEIFICQIKVFLDIFTLWKPRTCRAMTAFKYFAELNQAKFPLTKMTTSFLSYLFGY